MGIHASTVQAIFDGILAAALFSGGLGWYRRGLATGLVLAVSTGAILVFMTRPLLAPLTNAAHGSLKSSANSNAPGNLPASEDFFDQTCRAWQLGVIAGAAVSFAIGCWRYGLVTGVFLAICTGGVLLMATVPFWLALSGMMFRLT